MNPITAIVQRNLLNYVRSKGRVFGSLFMSMFMLVMFSFLMKSSMSGLDAPMPYLISGVIIMSVFQVSVNNSSDILSDISSGYMKEVLVAPIARTQISMGHILSGAVIATLQGVVTMLCGIVLGLRMNVLQILLLTAVMLISAMAFSAIGLFLATVSRNSPAFQTISSMIMMPLTFFGYGFPKLSRFSNPQFHDYDAPDLCFRRIYPHDRHARFSPAYRLPESSDLYNLNLPVYRFGGAYADHRGIGKTGHGFRPWRICHHTADRAGNYHFNWHLFLCAVCP